MKKEELKETKNDINYMKNLFETISEAKQQRALGFLEGLVAQTQQAS